LGNYKRGTKNLRIQIQNQTIQTAETKNGAEKRIDFPRNKQEVQTMIPETITIPRSKLAEIIDEIKEIKAEMEALSKNG